MHSKTSETDKSKENFWGLRYEKEESSLRKILKLFFSHKIFTQIKIDTKRLKTGMKLSAVAQICSICE